MEDKAKSKLVMASEEGWTLDTNDWRVSGQQFDERTSVFNSRSFGQRDLHLMGSVSEDTKMSESPIDFRLLNRLVRLDDLKTKYLEIISIVSLDVGNTASRKIAIDDLFVNVAIVEEATQRQQEKKIIYHTQNNLSPSTFEPPEFMTAPRNVKTDSRGIMHDCDDIYQKKTTINLEQLFSAGHVLQNGVNMPPPRHVVLLGRAGVGKSTLCNYMTCRWSKNDVWKYSPNAPQSGGFRYVFLLSLKEVVNHPNLKDEARIHIILYHMLWHKCEIKEIECEDLWYELRLKNMPILFILDGYDEVVDKQHGACEALVSIVANYSANANLHVITTSRPVTTFSSTVEMVIEDIGFLPDEVPHYINRYFANHEGPNDIVMQVNLELAQSLIQWLRERPKLAQICHVPINLEMLCSIWSDQKASMGNGQFVISDLYHRMLVKLMKGYLAKQLSTFEICNLKEQLTVNNMSQTIFSHELCKTALEDIEILAYESFKSNNLILTAATLDELNRIYPGKFGVVERKHLQKTGFLKAVGADCDSSNSTIKDSNAKEYFFAHLTFQEYLTGRYFARRFINNTITENDREYITENKFNPRFILIWTFISGVIASWEYKTAEQLLPQTALNNYYNCLLAKSRDLYGVYELELLVRCNEEAKWLECSVANWLSSYFGAWVGKIIDLTNSNDLNYIVRHLALLCVMCPMSMVKCSHNSYHGVFNIIISSSIIPEWCCNLENRSFQLMDMLLSICADIYFSAFSKWNIAHTRDTVLDLSTFTLLLVALCPAYYVIRSHSAFTIVLLLVSMFYIYLSYLMYVLYPIRSNGASLFISKLAFIGQQSVGPLLKLLDTENGLDCIHMLQLLHKAKFTLGTAELVKQSVYRRILDSDISLRMTSFRVYCEFLRIRPVTKLFTLMKFNEHLILLNTVICDLCMGVPKTMESLLCEILSIMGRTPVLSGQFLVSIFNFDTVSLVNLIVARFKNNETLLRDTIRSYNLPHETLSTYFCMVLKWTLMNLHLSPIVELVPFLHCHPDSCIDRFVSKDSGFHKAVQAHSVWNSTRNCLKESTDCWTSSRAKVGKSSCDISTTAMKFDSKLDDKHNTATGTPISEEMYVQDCLEHICISTDPTELAIFSNRLIEIGELQPQHQNLIVKSILRRITWLGVMRVFILVVIPLTICYGLILWFNHDNPMVLFYVLVMVLVDGYMYLYWDCRIINIISAPLLHPAFFPALLQNYPVFNFLNVTEGLRDILRMNLSQHQTAIWIDSTSDTVCWYQGRVLRKIKCRSIWRLKRDISKIRLVHNNYGSFMYYVGTWFSKLRNTVVEEKLAYKRYNSVSTTNDNAFEQYWLNGLKGLEALYNKLSTETDTFKASSVFPQSSVSSIKHNKVL